MSLGVLGSCGLGPWMVWLFTAIPCGLWANVPCSWRGRGPEIPLVRVAEGTEPPLGVTLVPG